MKGKFRPGLQKYVDALTDSVVRDTTTRAFRHAAAGRLRAAIEALCELKGVGPATASAVVSVLHFDSPFMADEALEAFVGTRTYTLAEWEELRRRTLAAAAAAEATPGVAPAPVVAGAGAGAGAGSGGGAGAAADEGAPAARKRQRVDDGDAAPAATAATSVPQPVPAVAPAAGPPGFAVFAGPVNAQRMVLSAYRAALAARFWH
jgi:hypothetical protein